VGASEITLPMVIANLTMLAPFFRQEYVDGVYWTLLVELKFYLLVLGLCMLGMTIKRVLGFAVGWLAISIWHAFVPLPSALKQLLVPEWAPYFVAGILFALIAREGWQKRYAIPLVVASGWAVYLAIDFAARATDLHGAPLSPYVVAGVVSGVFVLFALIASHKLQARWCAKLAFLGGLTYPLYLLHENIGFVLFELGHGRVNRWLLLAGVLAVVVTAAWLLHVLVENRCAAPFARLLRTRWEAVARVALDRGPLHDATGRQWTPPSMSAPAWSTARIF
jgi:peptidoglycan/LPS O-acetylase OafA/YrhL